jgi:Reverse transcriptase (RNA-dependent DNA polymerase)
MHGSSRYVKAVTMAETYATCVEQPACRLYLSLTAGLCLLAMGADAGNAFAEAPPPQQPFYMIIDDQFMEWWVESEGNPTLPDDYVLPVNNALHDHRESPRLWEKHIDNITTQHLHFKATTHEKCLYRRTDPIANTPELLLRQVDDFSVSAVTKEACMRIIAAIGKFLKVPLNDLGIIRKFNGVNVLQTRWYTKISRQDYLLKILTAHEWLDLKASTRQPLPTRSDLTYQRQLELMDRPTNATQQQSIQEQAEFSYRAHCNWGTYIRTGDRTSGDINGNYKIITICIKSGLHTLSSGSYDFCIP